MVGPPQRIPREVNANLACEERHPEQILLDPLSTMKREMVDGLVLEPAKTLAVVPKMGGAQALGIGHKRPGGGHVGLAGLGSLMGFQGQVGLVSSGPDLKYGVFGQTAERPDAVTVIDEGHRPRGHPEAIVRVAEYDRAPAQAP